MKTKFVLLYLILSHYLNAQIITTVVGNGTGGYSGDGGAAPAACIQGTFGITIDLNGNIYLSDYWHHVIRKVDHSSGVITTVVGTGTQGYNGDGGQATAAQISSPHHVAVDAMGNLFVADAIGVIRKVNPSGIISTVAGNGTSGYTGDGGLATQATLNSPVGIAVDNIGNIYIADEMNMVIRKVNSSGIINTIAGNNTAGFSGDGGQATAAQLNQPYGVSIDLKGNIYIADWNNSRIRKIDTSGIISTIAGTGTQGNSGNGGIATSAEVDWPKTVLPDAQGNVYIASGSLIQKINTSGIISIIAGTGLNGYSGDGGLATSAKISSPPSIAFNTLGDLYIADEGNYRVRKISNVTTEIKEITRTIEIKIYPNPSTDILNVELLDVDGAVLQITDILGNVVKTKELKYRKDIIDISYLGKGVYLYTLTLNNMPVKNGKLLIN